MIGKKCFPIGSTEVRDALGVGSIVDIYNNTHVEVVWANEEPLDIEGVPVGVLWPVDQVQIHCAECEKLFTPHSVHQTECSRICQLVNPE